MFRDDDRIGDYMSKRHKNKQQETKKRLDVIQSWMSSFAVTVVAVVAAVIFIPASPKGEITKTIELYDQVTYQVFVTDEDEALDLSTLCVVLENSMEYYEHPIALGESSGYFSELTHNTFYRLSIYGSNGFGQESLDTMRVKPQ